MSDNRLTHFFVSDNGLTLKNTATGDNKPSILTLASGETDIAANDVIGAINFQAPDEGTGTDAILVCAGIEAVSEGDFASDNNATKLSFKTGSSETATEKMYVGSNKVVIPSTGYNYMFRVDDDTTNNFHYIAMGHVNNNAPNGLIDMRNIGNETQPLLYIANSAVGQNAAQISGNNTTGNMLDILGNSMTTGSLISAYDGSNDTNGRDIVSISQDNASATNATALYIASSGGHTGVSINKDYSNTSGANVYGINLDLDKTGASTSNNNIYGLNIDLDNTTATDGVNNMIGLKLTPTLTHAADAGTPTVKGAVITATGGTNGTATSTGMELTSTGADTNLGLVINCADGGTDLKIVSSADTGDYSSITTTANGATTLATIDDDGTNANLTLDVDGTIIMNSKDNANNALSIDGATATIHTLGVTGLASLDGGIDVDGAFTVADASGNVSTTGTLQAAATTFTSDTDGEFVALKLVNESDANNTTGIVSLEFDLEDTSGTAVDAGKISVKKNEAFTSTASTQDSNMVFSTSLNGTLTEHVSLSSAGTLTTKHILPDADDTYDLGSAEKRFKDLYLTTASIWLGDEHKISINAEGSFSLGKRNKTVLPKEISDIAGTGSTGLAAINSALGTSYANINLIKTHELLDYYKGTSGNSGKTLVDIYTDGNMGDDFENDFKVGGEITMSSIVDLPASATGQIKVLAVSGPDAAGQNLKITSGAGTGSGAGGSIIFETANAGSSGSSANTPSTKMTLNSDGDLAIFDDRNNADTSLSIGTSSTEALVIQVLNGSTNKTAEEIKFITKTASTTGNHGKMTFAVDETDILEINDSGITVTGALTGNVTGNVTGNASGSALTVTQAAQTAITSVGTLTALQVDNVNINGNTISSTAGTDLNITPLAGQQIVLDGTIVVDAGVVTGATSITSTAFAGALTGNVTGNASGTAATVTTAAQTAITSVGTLTALQVDNINIDGNTITSSTAADLIINVTDGQSVVIEGIDIDDGVITMNNGATIVNTDEDTLTITEATTAFAGIVTVSSHLTVSGNLTINGTTTTVNTATLSVEDPLIILASGNGGANTVDIGFYGLYDKTGGQDLYAGLFRDASDSGKFKLFEDLQVVPTNTVDITGAGYAKAILVADIEGNVTGALTGNADTATVATTVTITDNESTNEANAIIFTAGGDVDGGNLGLESDGTLTYNPSTGKITATGFVGDVTGNASGTALTVTQAAQGAITSVGTLTGLNVAGDNVTFSSANATDPLVIIKNTTNDTDGARLRFVKDKGAAGANNDYAGLIEFYADDDNQDQVLFAKISAQVADASNGAEGGKLSLGVATHDGEFQNGLVLTDGSVEDEIDVTIGNGVASVTTIAGLLDVTGAVGIGTTSPMNSLQLSHTAADSDNGLMIVREDTSTATNDFLGGIGFDSTDGNVPSSVLEAAAGIGAYASEAHGTGDKGGYLTLWTSSENDNDDTAATERMRITDEGNVGIGTTAPTGKLHISSGNSGDCALVIQADTDNNNETDNPMIIFKQDGAYEPSAICQGNNFLHLKNVGPAAWGHGITFQTAINSSGSYTDAVIRMKINPSGQVGIGDSDSNGISNNAWGGTLLQLESTEPYLTLKNNTAENTNGGCESKIIFEDHSNTALAQIQASHDGTADDTKGDLIFSTHTGSALTEGMRIDSSQNVIIPEGKLMLGSTSVTATATELNLVDTSSAGSIVNSKAVIYGSSGEVNATTLQIAGTQLAFNHLSDCLIETNSLYLGNDPSGTTSTAQYNVGVGVTALNSITSGDNNIAIGYDAGTALTTGESNVAIGLSSLLAVTGGSNNVAIGHRTLRVQNTGIADNVAIGSAAGSALTTGTKCVIIGKDAAGGATTSDNCVVIGEGTCAGTMTGNNNVVIGQASGTALEGGHSNTIIGSASGDELTTGTNNTVIGYNAAASAATVENEVTLGDTNVDTLRCASSVIASTSDRRDKKEIKSSDYGIEFIKKVRPVEFTWAKRNRGESFNGKRRLGFIAQELQAAMPNGENKILDLVYESNPEHLEAKYGNLVPILTKSVQELAEKSAVLEEKSAVLEEENKQLKERLNRLEEMVNKLL